mmetsp:Transcript_7209/g.20915  ORF Transcript_7209/g.20915 Transcript_7209/m.20915 type:complete len:280 (-) Transcript_7209:737-1576(-)
MTNFPMAMASAVVVHRTSVMERLIKILCPTTSRSTAWSFTPRNRAGMECRRSSYRDLGGSNRNLLAILPPVLVPSLPSSSSDSSRYRLRNPSWESLPLSAAMALVTLLVVSAVLTPRWAMTSLGMSVPVPVPLPLPLLFVGVEFSAAAGISWVCTSTTSSLEGIVCPSSIIPRRFPSRLKSRAAVWSCGLGGMWLFPSLTGDLDASREVLAPSRLTIDPDDNIFLASPLRPRKALAMASKSPPEPYTSMGKYSPVSFRYRSSMSRSLSNPLAQMTFPMK